jgi:hypothetical protein
MLDDLSANNTQNQPSPQKKENVRKYDTQSTLLQEQAVEDFDLSWAGVEAATQEYPGITV